MEFKINMLIYITAITFVFGISNREWGVDLTILFVLVNIISFITGGKIAFNIYSRRVHEILDKEISNLQEAAKKQEEEELEELKKKEKELGLEILEKE